MYIYKIKFMILLNYIISSSKNIFYTHAYQASKNPAYSLIIITFVITIKL